MARPRGASPGSCAAGCRVFGVGKALAAPAAGGRKGICMIITDTHAHYDEEAFDPDRDQLLRSELPCAGVEFAVNMGASMEGAESSVRLAQEYPIIYAGCGIHPDSVGIFEKDADAMRHLKSLCRSPKVVCVGEIGLDYHWMVETKEVQGKWFAAQLLLARELNLPINVHSREASLDTFDIIVKYHTESCVGAGRHTTTGGVIHCYSGSADMAAEYVKMGYHIGVGGVVTFKNSKRLRKVVEAIPLSAIVTETDCPYMAPEPVRGSRNDSRNIRYMIEKIAEIKGMDKEECAGILRRNAMEVYRIGT